MPRTLLPALFCISLAAFASDLKYTRKISDPTGEHRPITYSFQGERIRVDHRNEFGYDWNNGKPETVAYGPRMATIYQCDMHRVLELDFDHHQYTVMDLDRRGVPLKARNGNLPAHSNGGKVKLVVENRDTGETRTEFGQTARHFVTTRKMIPSPGSCATTAQETTEDGWYLDIEPRADSCMGMNQPPRHRAVTILASANCIDDYEVQQSGPEPPAFPVELTITTHVPGAASQQSHALTELVTDLSRLPLDPQIFDLPTGFKRVDKLDNSPNLPWLLRGRLMWQSVKSTVWGWTPWGK